VGNWCVWTRDVVRGAVVLDTLRGLEDEFRLNEGVPLADGFPSDVGFEMNPNRPTNLLFVDNLYNLHRAIVASERLAAFLQERPMPHVEFLPVGIIDHRGRVARQRYLIVHPIDPVDCLDLAASMPDWSEIDRSAIRKVDRLVLDHSRVDPSRTLFRIRGYDKVVLVRRDLADAVAAAGFSGVTFVPLDEYVDG
jgi:hypothetical protein